MYTEWRDGVTDDGTRFLTIENHLGLPVKVKLEEAIDLGETKLVEDEELAFSSGSKPPLRREMRSAPRAAFFVFLMFFFPINSKNILIRKKQKTLNSVSPSYSTHFFVSLVLIFLKEKITVCCRAPEQFLLSGRTVQAEGCFFFFFGGGVSTSTLSWQQVRKVYSMLYPCLVTYLIHCRTHYLSAPTTLFCSGQ